MNIKFNPKNPNTKQFKRIYESDYYIKPIKESDIIPITLSDIKYETFNKGFRNRPF